MATTYNADTYADVQLSAPPAQNAVFRRPFSFNIADTVVGFVINDVVNLCPIPYKSAGNGILVIGYQVEIPALDSSTGIVVGLGDNNGASAAFQATFCTAAPVGASAHAGVLSPLVCLSNNAIIVGTVRGAVPKQYTAAAVYTAQGNSYITVNFQLKITTAPTGTASTTGIIKGWLDMQQIPASSVTY